DLSDVEHVADFVQFLCFFPVRFALNPLFELLPVLVQDFDLPRTRYEMLLRLIQLLLALFNKQLLCKNGVLRCFQFQADGLQVLTATTNFETGNGLSAMRKEQVASK